MKTPGPAQNRRIPFDLNPAIRVVFLQGAMEGEWHVIPHDDKSWKLTNAKSQRAELTALNLINPNFKDIIRLIKFWSKRKGIGLRSFVVVSFIAHLAIEKHNEWVSFTPLGRISWILKQLWNAISKGEAICDLQTKENINSFDEQGRDEMLKK